MSGSQFERSGSSDPVRDASRERAVLVRQVRETCEWAVSRVLAELPPGDRRMVEACRDRVVEATHRETMAALDEVVGLVEAAARG